MVGLTLLVAPVSMGRCEDYLLLYQIVNFTCQTFIGNCDAVSRQ